MNHTVNGEASNPPPLGYATGIYFKYAYFTVNSPSPINRNGPFQLYSFRLFYKYERRTNKRVKYSVRAHFPRPCSAFIIRQKGTKTTCAHISRVRFVVSSARARFGGRTREMCTNGSQRRVGP